MAKNDLMNGVHDGRTIWHVEQEIRGKKGHAIVPALFIGEVIYASGETGTYAGVEVIEVAGVKESFAGKMVILLKDGSVSNQTFEGKGKFEDGRSSGTGRWKLVKGTGRFAGLRGGGPFEWTVVGDKYDAQFSATTPRPRRAPSRARRRAAARNRAGS